MSSEIFKTKQEPVMQTQSEPIAGPVQPEGKPLDELQGEKVNRLDLYETEKGHKYAEDYFGFRELIAGDFKLKMDISRIDKYIKQSMQEKGYDHTTSTYQNLLAEMESLIGSRLLTPQKRLQKIINYISINQKIDKAKELKQQFLATYK